jgi:uncharacterized protein
MPNVQPPVGAPCWFELVSRDPETSAGFHAALFGWRPEPMGPGAPPPYRRLRGAGGVVGALTGRSPEERAADAPSSWGVLFRVGDCDASAARARELGGEILGAPKDVPGEGRMAVVRDPTGAVFGLWQPFDPAGVELALFEDFAVGWVELATRDPERAAAFYSGLLGWELSLSEIPVGSGLRYTHYALAGTQYGGILPMTAEWGETPPHWSIYVVVPDIDACVARALELGGSVPVPAFDAPGVGRIARIADPTGAGCYLIRLDPALAR